MTKKIKVTVNKTVQFVVNCNRDNTNEAYEELKLALENNTQLDEMLGDTPYKVRFEVENLDKVVIYDSETNIISEEESPIEWKG